MKSFDVSAVRVSDLFDAGSEGGARGLVYSQRHGITDPEAVIYVVNRERACRSEARGLRTTGCFEGDERSDMRSDDTVLAGLRAEFARGRPVEPMVLRAAAGQCITVHLRNHLPRRLPVAQREGPVEDRDATHNLLPMIADGFNMNQLRMSNSVGLSVPKLAQNPVGADGANVGLNGAGVAISPNAQGSLIAPCAPSDHQDARRSTDFCALTMVWSATDLRRPAGASKDRVVSVPVEFGALPLRSFGDAIQQPAHGLVGALVVGPAGSEVCADDAAGHAFPGGTSREICPAGGGERYTDHVLVMQDAVSAVQGGFPVGNLDGAEEPDDYGVKAINYRTEPLWARRGGSPGMAFGERNAEFDYSEVFGSAMRGERCESDVAPVAGDRAPTPCDPETPVIAARAGMPLRLHFVHPGGHTRQQGLTVAGHGFNPYPWSADSTAMAPQRCQPAAGQALPSGCLLWQGVVNAFGPMMSQTLALRAGGAAGLSKDYLIKTESSFALDGGQWGILRTTPPSPTMPEARP